MADARATVLPWPLEPDRVARAAFSHSFRGFDPTEVRSFLARVAGELAALRAREAELTARISELEHRRPVTPANLDEHQITELLGAEAARVLDAAREAATAIRTNADRHASELLDEARAEADNERAGAATFVEDRRAEAEAEATRVLDTAELEADRLTGEARAALDEAHQQADARLDAAREDGRRMVAEARAVRERILTDMARRRNHARQQLERLRAGRERLLDAIEAVRAAAEQVAGELSGSLVEARLAGERAGRQVDVDAIPSLNELAAEVELAKDAGLIDLDAIERELMAGGGAGVDLAGAGPELEPLDGPDAAVEGAGDETPVGEPAIEVIEVVDLVWAEDAPPAAAEAAVGAEDAADAGTAPRPAATVNGRAPTTGEPAVVSGQGVPEAAGSAAVAEPEAAGSAAVAEPEAAGSAAAAEPEDGGDEDAPERTEAAEPAASEAAEPARNEEEPAGDEAEPAGAEAEAAAPAAAAEPADPADDGAAPPSTRGRARRRPTPARPTATTTSASDAENRKAASPRSRATTPTSRRKRSAPARPAEFSDAVDDVFSRMKGGPAADEAAPDALPSGPDADAASEVEGETPATATPAPGGNPAPAGAAYDDRTALHTRDALLAGISRDLVRGLKLALSDEQNVVLDRARGVGSGRIRGVDLPDTEATTARYRGVARRELSAAFAAGWQAALAPPGLNGDPGGPIEQAPQDDADLDAVVDELITALTAPVRERLADLADLADADADQPEDQVRNLYRETRNHRVAGVAEHATLSAHAVGQLVAFARSSSHAAGNQPGGSDRPAEVRWVFEACSPDCLDNSLAGPVPVGQPFPTGHLHPPAFPGCRCLLVGAVPPPDPEPTPRGRVSTTAV